MSGALHSAAVADPPLQSSNHFAVNVQMRAGALASAPASAMIRRLLEFFKITLFFIDYYLFR